MLVWRCTTFAVALLAGALLGSVTDLVLLPESVQREQLSASRYNGGTKVVPNAATRSFHNAHEQRREH